MFNYVTKTITSVACFELCTGNSIKIYLAHFEAHLPLILFGGTWQCDT